MKINYKTFCLLFGLILGSNYLHAETPPVYPTYLEGQVLHLKKPSRTTSKARSYEAKSLIALIEELLTYNPELQALVHSIQAYEMRVPQASALDDPRLGFEASNLPWKGLQLDRTPMTGLQLYFRQKIPFPGKLKLKKKIAQSQWQEEQQVYYERLNQLVAKFKKAYYQYAFVNEAILLQQKTRARLATMAKFLEARYAAGESPQQDILKTKLEISNIDSLLLKLKADKKIKAARINSLLYRPPQMPLKTQAIPIKFKPLVFNLKELTKIAKNRRPWLKKSQLQIEEADLSHRLAKKSLLPDFDFALGYRFRADSVMDPVEGEDFLSLGFSVNLPIYAPKKQKKHIQETLHLKQKNTYLKKAMEEEVRFQVTEIYQELSRLRAQIKLLNNTTLPQNRATRESAKLSYETGQVDFLNLILSEIGLLKNELERAEFQYEYQEKLADMEMATGLPLHILESNN